MTPLKDHIRKNGYDYFQEQECAHGYLYRQELHGELIGYEVFRRKENERFGCISFPGGEAFGVWAWSFWGDGARGRALAKFESIQSQ